jgi:hypothetical protein
MIVPWASMIVPWASIIVPWTSMIVLSRYSLIIICVQQRDIIRTIVLALYFGNATAAASDLSLSPASLIHCRYQVIIVYLLSTSTEPICNFTR